MSLDLVTRFVGLDAHPSRNHDGDMERQGLSPSPPIPDLSIDGSDQQCPECGHERGVPYYGPWGRLADWLRIPRKPRAARCEWRVEYEADACDCGHPFHGS